MTTEFMRKTPPPNPDSDLPGLLQMASIFHSAKRPLIATGWSTTFQWDKGVPRVQNTVKVCGIQRAHYLTKAILVNSNLS